jgi:NAD(P)H dehydrogenase (quinone)
MVIKMRPAKSLFNLKCEMRIMPKILVIYDSDTGNTEKMAHHVAEGAKQVGRIEVEVKKVDKINFQDLQQYDGIIIGSPTYYGLMSGKVKTLLDQSEKIHGKLEGKVGAAFTSSGGVASGAETTLLSIIQSMLIHGMVVQGRSEGSHYGAAAVGDPGDKVQVICHELGKRTAELLKKLKR